MKNKTLAIVIIGVVVVAVAIVLLAPVAMAYGPRSGNGLGLNQIVDRTGLGVGQGNRAGMQDGTEVGLRDGSGLGQGQMMRGGGQGQDMMQNSAMMRGGMNRGRGRGMMQDGPMIRGGMNGGLGLGAPAKSLIAVVAEQLNIEQAKLTAELQSGQTMADVIAAHDVELETVVDAFLDPRAEQLAARVAAETITQAQADFYLAMMQARVTQQLQSEWTAGQGQSNGRGACDHAGQGQGPNFVDEDGDGLCDQAGTGSGRQAGRQGGGKMGGGRWQ